MLRIDGRGGPVIGLHGALDGVGAAELAGVLAAARDDVRVDCSDVELIDGPGLSALVVATRACRVRGVEVVFSCVHESAVSHLRARHVLDHVLPMEPAATAPSPAPAVAASGGGEAGGVQLAARPNRRRRGSSWRWRHS